jgi:hypothetical protein
MFVLTSRISFYKTQHELTEYQTNMVSINKYSSDLQTYIAVKKIEKGVETNDTFLQALSNSENINQTKLSYRIDTGFSVL